MLKRTQAELIGHALGDPVMTGRPWKKTGRHRNYYCGDATEWAVLVAEEKATRTEGTVLTGGSPLFRVTPAGVAALDSYLTHIDPHRRRKCQDLLNALESLGMKTAPPTGPCPYCDLYHDGVRGGCEWNPDENGPASCCSPHHLATPATLHVGTGRDNWRLCAECAALPRFKSKRKRVPIVRRDA